MPSDIVVRLYNAFYKPSLGAVDTQQSSEHWKNFSKNFKVELNADQSVHTIKGYGFGGSDDNRTVAKITALIANSLLLFQLNYPGLASETSDAKKLVKSMGLTFSKDAFRQVCTKYLLEKEAEKNNIAIKNILIIGDGHGILAALLSERYPDAKIFLIDLGATLFFQAYYLGQAFPNKKHVLLGKVNEESNEHGFYYCPAEWLQNFPLQEIDLAINVASMQEMTIGVVNNYFRMMRERKTKLFYCCNRLEKTLPDGQVTQFKDYGWKNEDIHLIDEKCPWHQYFFGRGKSENVKLMNILPIPLLHRYDGVHWHRLSLLSH